MAVRSKAAEVFRANVRAIIHARGMSSAKLAEMTDIGAPGLCRILAGKEGVTLDRAERIADALNVPLTNLLQTVEQISVPA